jgi:prophage regulatory protein
MQTNAHQQTAPVQFLRLPEVEKLTGIKRTHIYRLQQLGRFPKRVKLGARASAYIASEVQGWIAERIAESRGTVAK